MPEMTEPILSHEPQIHSTPNLDEDLSKYDLVSVNFWNYAIERVIKTFAMTFSSLLTTAGATLISDPSASTLFSDIGWQYILTVSGVAAFTSFLVALSSFRNIITIKPMKKKANKH